MFFSWEKAKKWNPFFYFIFIYFWNVQWKKCNNNYYFSFDLKWDSSEETVVDELKVINYPASDEYGRKAYHGQVRNGKAEGVGTLFYNTSSTEKRVRYEGQFRWEQEVISSTFFARIFLYEKKIKRPKCKYKIDFRTKKARKKRWWNWQQDAIPKQKTI